MILDFFSERGIKRFVFILFCIIVLFWQKILAVGEPVVPYSIISVDNLLHAVAVTNIYLSGCIKLLLLLVCSYCFIITLSVNDVLPKRKYLAVMLFLAVMSVLTDSLHFANLLCALLFMLFALYNGFRIYHSEAIKSLVFTAAFFIGISSMFSFPFIISSIYVLITLWIFYMVKWRDVISIVLGLLTPFVFLMYFFQLAYHDINLMWQLIENSFTESISVSFDNFDILKIAFLGLVFLTGLFSTLKIIAVKRIKNVYRMTDRLFYFVFFVSVTIFVALYGMQSYAIATFGISSACLITRLSQIINRTWFIEFIIFVILFAAIAYNNYSLWL